MSVVDQGTIDAIGVENATGRVVLTISDHLDWADAESHMLAVQDKLNTYLAFVESGEIVESYPDASGRSVVFDLVMRVSPDAQGAAFLTRVQEVVQGAGIEMRCRVLGE